MRPGWPIDVSAASFGVALLVTAASCGGGDPAPVDAAPVPGWSATIALPEPTSNNAVAAIVGADGCTLVSATGIGASRAAAGIHTRAWLLAPDAAAWSPLPDAPGPPRIAASAVALRGRVYVIGGYSVATNGSETTYDGVAVLEPATGWTMAAPLPLAIDDAVAIAWRDRWIVVVSGWSHTAPTTAVQVYDADTNMWTMGTPFAGTPVFGHAGAVAGDELVVFDGVAARLGGFGIVKQAWRGVLDPERPGEIAWSALGEHPGPPRYRAAGGTIGGRVVIHGGTATPYNFDGLRYDTNAAAEPLGDSFALEPATGMFAEDVPVKRTATMDHRALVTCGDLAFTIGGMASGPEVTATASQLR